MDKSTTTLIFIFLFFFFLIFSKSETLKANNCSGLFIFGDSFVDAGNNNYINTSKLDQANFWPYGVSFFHFPTGRFSDGRLVSDFVAEYAKLPLIKPFLEPGNVRFQNGVNFASAGAGALPNTFQGFVINLKTQVNHYKNVVNLLREKLGNDEAKKVISRGVYLFSIGSNDYTSPFLTNDFSLFNSSSHSQYVEIVIGNLTSAIKEIYKIGGRKFAFINLPNMGCFPAMRILRKNENGRCFQVVSKLTKLHNQAFSKTLVDLKNQFKGFKYTIFDFHGSLQDMISHPSKYGFVEGERACCGTGPYRGVLSCGGTRPVKEYELCENPNNYIFWDSFHLTQSANKQLAYQMWNGPTNLNKFFQVC